MAKKTFRCKLVTPAAALFDSAVSYASVPAWDGLIGFLPGRAAFLGKLGIGELRLDLGEGEKGESKSFFLDGGFVRMADDQMTILAERAVPAENVTSALADAESKAAERETDPTKRTAALSRASALSKLAARARA